MAEFGKHTREQEMKERYGEELGPALYWAWHRQPQRGDIIRKKFDELSAKLARVEARLAAALIVTDYAQHEAGCGIFRNGVKIACDCGLDEDLKALSVFDSEPGNGS